MKNLVSVLDLVMEEVEQIYHLARELKAGRRAGEGKDVLAGMTLAMLFEKSSLRTRVTFEVGMTELGGHAICLSPADVKMGVRESVTDVARNLSRWVHGIVARVNDHETLRELAAEATVPVINGLSDLEHPCQALTDFFTIRERWQRIKGVKIAFIGDGNNVCHSLILLGAMHGAAVWVATPHGYRPRPDVVAQARELAAKTGGSITLTEDHDSAARDAQVVYTDVWASMGQEHEAEARVAVFCDYQVNSRLMGLAADDAIFMHCLPAKRGQEVTDAVIDGPASVVLDQAENRLHVQKAILCRLIGGARWRG